MSDGAQCDVAGCERPVADAKFLHAIPGWGVFAAGQWCAPHASVVLNARLLALMELEWPQALTAAEVLDRWHASAAAQALVDAISDKDAVFQAAYEAMHASASDPV